MQLQNRFLGIFFIYYFSCGLGVCQNLIPNPSFEETIGCPSNHTTQKEPIKTKDWYSPSLAGTPDLFSSCSFNDVSTPQNFAGIAYPPDGENYVGMYFGKPHKTYGSDYREYLMCRLLKPLDSGLTYRLQYFVRPATHSTNMINLLSFVFTKDSLSVHHDKRLEIAYNSVLVDTLEILNGWYKVDYTFTANGSEKYFLIGDFVESKDAHFESLRFNVNELKPGGATYYLFDDFVLDSPKKENPVFVTEEPFSLDKIYFAFDSSELLLEAYDDLKVLADYLSKNPNQSLLIYGNTDSIGSDNYNQRLSSLRALSVKRALIDLGVKDDKLQVFGNGEKDSIYELDSLNRRTEFVLINGN